MYGLLFCICLEISFWTLEQMADFFFRVIKVVLPSNWHLIKSDVGYKDRNQEKMKENKKFCSFLHISYGSWSVSCNKGS